MICGPILVNGNHWCGFLADNTNGRFIYIDPFGNLDEEVVAAALTSWIKFAKFKTLKANWANYDVMFSIQKKNDTHNCGVYISKYLKMLINSNENLIIPNTAAAMLNYRSEISKTLKTKLTVQ